MRIAMIAFAGLAFALAPAAHAQKAGNTDKSANPAKPGERDDVMYSSKRDPEMNAARARARKEVPGFLLHVITPRPDESDFMVKYDLLPETDEAEYIWADIVSRQPGAVTATLANKPVDDRFELGQTVVIRDEQIVDWGYRRDGVMQGHYTTRVMIDRMPEARAAEIRRLMGW